MHDVNGDTTVGFTLARKCLPGTYDLVFSIRGIVFTLPSGFVVDV